VAEAKSLGFSRELTIGVEAYCQLNFFIDPMEKFVPIADDPNCSMLVDFLMSQRKMRPQMGLSGRLSKSPGSYRREESHACQDGSTLSRQHTQVYIYVAVYFFTIISIIKCQETQDFRIELISSLNYIFEILPLWYKTAYYHFPLSL